MAKKRETTSAAEALIKGRTYGEFRCLNCYERVTAPAGAETYKCLSCSFEWRIMWVDPTFPRIRGPVWDANRRLAEEQTGKKEKGRE